MLIFNELAFGLDWRSGSFGRRKTIQAYKKEGKKPRAIVQIVDTDGQLFFGFSEKNISNKNTRSIAGLLCSTTQFNTSGQLAFLFSLEGEIHGLVCIANGSPVSGFDFVGTKDDCVYKLQEFLTVASSQGSVAIYCNGMQGAIDFNLTDFLAQESRLSRIQDVTMKSILPPAKVFGVMGGAVVVAGLGFVGFSMYQSHKAEQERAQQLLLQQQAELARTQPEAVFKEALLNLVATATRSVNVPALWAHYASATATKGTWVRASVRCDALNCAEVFKPRIAGIVRWEDWAQAEDKNITYDFAQVQVELGALSYEQPKPEGAPDAFFGTKAEMFEWVDRIKAIKVGTLTVGKRSDFTTLPILEGKPKYVFYPFEYSGPLWVMQLPHSAGGMSVESVSLEVKPMLGFQTDVSIEEKGKMNIKGVFYVKE